MRILRSTAFVLSIFATACGKSSEAPHDPGSHWQVTGPLSSAVDEVSKAKLAGSCDRAFQQMRVELAAAIDAHADLIAKNPNAGSANKNQKLIPFQGTQLVDAPLEKVSKQGWQPYRYSWQNVYRVYKNNMDNEDPGYWAALNLEVRGILTDDVRRTKYGMNFGIEREDLKFLPAFRDAIQKCYDDSSCVEPSLTDELKDFVSRVKLYTDASIALTAAKATEEKRKVLKSYAERAQADFEAYDEKPYSAATTRKDSSGFVTEIPIYAPMLTDAEKEVLRSSVERRWKNDQRLLTPRFVDAKSTDVFQLFFSNEAGTRPYVLPTEKEIHLFPYNSTLSIGHEFGHVLGFADHYVTVWDWQNCVYTEWLNQEDIMNVSSTGSVTQDEWQWIEKNYLAK